MTLDLSQAASWSGVWTALVTPLLPGLELDEKSLRALIDDQIKKGVRGLVIAGSTGEGSLLSAPVYERLLQRAREFAGSRIPLLAGLGIGGTESCLRNLELARKADFNGVLASPPAYIKTPQRGLMAHFLRIAGEGLPVCLYEVPGRAASSLENATIVEMIRNGGHAAGKIVAIKDASADLARPLGLKREFGDRLALLSGDDATFAAFMASGGDGVISVVSHFVPKAMGAILKSAREGRIGPAATEQARLLPFIDELFRESNPIPVKSLLASRKMIQDDVFCPPLCPMKPELLARLERVATETPDIA